MTRRSFGAILLPALLAAALAASGPLRGEPARGTILTNETIVRLVAAGTPEAEIVRIIRQSDATAFDLDPEVVEELKAVGVTAPILEAMRQATPAPAPPPPSGPEAAPARGRLRLAFERGAAGSKAEQWSAVTPETGPQGKPVGLSAYLACRTPTHVPDLWDRRSKLGGWAGRHELIWMHDGTRPAGKRFRAADDTLGIPRGTRLFPREGRVPHIALDLPVEPLLLPLDAGEHQLAAGVAVRVGEGPWRSAREIPLRVRIEPGADASVTLRLRTRDAPGLDFETWCSAALQIEVISADPPLPPARTSPPP